MDNLGETSVCKFGQPSYSVLFALFKLSKWKEVTNQASTDF